VSGDEIIKWLGLTPGRIVGEIKEQIKDAILDGVIHNDREEAIRFMIQVAQKRGINVIESNILNP
jgi:poly(A) polymerase